jgi:glycosyltransferase involved in cell wall biosynthesis
MKKLKILHTVEQYFPSVGGMQEVVKRISELLVSRGHSVTVATRTQLGRTSREINGVQIEEFNIRGNAAHGISGPDIEKYKNYLVESDFDIVVNFAAQQWATDLAYEVLPKIRAKKILVPTGFSGLYDADFHKYFRKLPEYLRLYDAHVFLSDDYRDIHFARAHKIKNLFLIPNGASLEEFSKPATLDIRKKLGMSKDDYFILHVGSHTGMKGHGAAINIFRQAKIDNSRLVIVGNTFENANCRDRCEFQARLVNTLPAIDTIGSWKRILVSIIKGSLKGRIFRKYGVNKKVIVQELTREETVAAYHAADLFLFPSQIECSPIVFFECMASKTPFLSTDVGNASEIVEWSGGGEIMPTAYHGFCVSAIIDLTFSILEKFRKNPEYGLKLAEQGHQAWLEKFTWEKIAGQYEELYTVVLNGFKVETVQTHEPTQLKILD